MKREINERFSEENDLGKQRNELLNLLSKAMGKMQNRMKQSGNEGKILREVLSEKHEQVNEGMGKLQNETKQLSDEINNTRDGPKEEYKRINEDIGKLQNGTKQLVNKIKNIQNGLQKKMNECKILAVLYKTPKISLKIWKKELWRL